MSVLKTSSQRTEMENHAKLDYIPDKTTRELYIDYARGVKGEDSYLESIEVEVRKKKIRVKYN